MPIRSSLYISGSVGAGGRNKRKDVSAVQQRLNALMHPPRQALTVDGLSGPKTTRMIRDFQKNAVGFRRGDGRVDPDGRTIRTLTESTGTRTADPLPSPPQPSSIASTALRRASSPAGSRTTAMRPEAPLILRSAHCTT